jgi:hypothetical protein
MVMKGPFRVWGSACSWSVAEMSDMLACKAPKENINVKPWVDYMKGGSGCRGGSGREKTSRVPGTPSVVH